MTEMPRYGQRSDGNVVPECPRHPDVPSIDYCKRCNRPMCQACAIPTEVRSICVDCAQELRRRIPRSAPIVTYSIVAACVAIYLIGWVSPVFERALMFAPVLGYREPWRFLTTAFLHASLWHIGFNMLALYWVGRPIENTLGRWRFIALYILSAVGGSLAVLLWVFAEPQSWLMPTVGASGAVFGLFGAVFVLQRISGNDTRAVVILLGVNLIYGFITPGISWQAHVGGLLTGLALTWVMSRFAKPVAGRTERSQETQSALVVSAIAVGMCAVIAGTYWALLS